MNSANMGRVIQLITPHSVVVLLLVEPVLIDEGIRRIFILPGYNIPESDMAINDRYGGLNIVRLRRARTYRTY